MKRRKPVPAAAGCDLVCNLGGGLKVVSFLDDFDAECSHGCIFLDAVPDRDDNSRGDAKLARGESDGLAVISSRRGNHSLRLPRSATEVLEVHQTAPYLECTRGRMVLV